MGKELSRIRSQLLLGDATLPSRCDGAICKAMQGSWQVIRCRGNCKAGQNGPCACVRCPACGGKPRRVECVGSPGSGQQ